jgi:hypothetical protein
MGFGFELELLDDKGAYATLYSFRKTGEDFTELEKFWQKTDVQNAPDHHNLRRRLYRDVLERHNFSHFKCFQGPDRWFRAEGDATDPVGMNAEALCADIPAEDRAKLSKPYPRLRLYCFRKCQVLVAGNGGVKEDQQIRDDPELLGAWNDVRHVMKRVHKRLQRGAITQKYEYDDGYVETGFVLTGNLYFEAPDYR